MSYITDLLHCPSAPMAAGGTGVTPLAQLLDQSLKEIELAVLDRRAGATFSTNVYVNLLHPITGCAAGHLQFLFLFIFFFEMFWSPQTNPTVGVVKNAEARIKTPP